MYQLIQHCWIQHCSIVCHTRSSNNFCLIKCWMKFDFHQIYCPTNIFDQQTLDSLAKASTKLHREKRRAYSAAQSHIVNCSRDLILVDKMAELDEVVENPIKQPIKPSPPIFVHFVKICGSTACKIWSNCSGPISIISLNPRVSCIFSSFIVINIPRSFRLFIHFRVFPRSQPSSSSKRSKI